CETKRDDAVVVRPDGTSLIRNRVVGRNALRQRANPPTAPHIRLHQPLDDATGTVRSDQTAPHAVPRVGGNRPNRLLIRVECERIETDVVAPESFLEPALQICRTSS